MRFSNRAAYIVVSASLLAACSSSPGGTGGAGGQSGTGGSACALYVVPSGTNLMQPLVSFKSEVMPIFNASCGLANCHATTVDKLAPNFFLGDAMAMGSDEAAVHAAIVGQNSGELPTMPFVSAGHPESSYLMHKVDGDQCHFDAQCVTGSCKLPMPNGGTPLTLGARDTLRRWIAQNAPDN
jgi:hypothetical protein